MRGQGGNEHGGSPWFKRGVEAGRAPAGEGRELLTQWVDERVRSLSHRGAVSFNRHKPFSLLDSPGMSRFSPLPLELVLDVDVGELEVDRRRLEVVVAQDLLHRRQADFLLQGGCKSRFVFLGNYAAFLSFLVL